MTAIVIDSNVKSVRAKEFVANDKTFARTGNMIETGPTSHTICDVVNLQGNSVAIENYILLSPFPNSLSYYCRKVTVNKMIAFTGTSKVSLVYLPLGIDTPDDGVKTVISSTVFNGGSIGTPIVNATMEPPLAYTTIYTTGNSPIGYVVAKDPGIVGTNISLKIVLGTATTPVISSVYIDDKFDITITCDATTTPDVLATLINSDVAVSKHVSAAHIVAQVAYNAIATEKTYLDNVSIPTDTRGCFALYALGILTAGMATISIDYTAAK